MKIAILISGFPRTFKSCRQSLFDNLININNHEFDIYLYTWQPSKNQHNSNLKDEDNIYDINELIETYKPKKYVFENVDDWMKNNKLKTGQWYTLQKCWELMESTNTKYDLVIRYRFDCLIRKPYHILNVGSQIITPRDCYRGYDKNNQRVLINLKDNIDYINDYCCINDKMAIGSYDIMKIYCNVQDEYFILLDDKKKVTAINQLSTEGTLAEYLKKYSIDWVYDPKLIIKINR
jgi:hypothetical protein